MWPNIFFYPQFNTSNEKPPTIYALMKSIVNFDKPVEEQKKTYELAKYARTTFFDFEYPLSTHVTKEEFETNILNHYIERRIGFDTVTSFKIHLNNKLNEIMPKYNKMIDMLDGWDIFRDGEEYTREVTDNRTTSSETTATTNSESDQRYSDMPQNKIEQVKDGSYIKDYSFNKDNGTSTGKSDLLDNNIEREHSSKTQNNKLELYTKFMNEVTNIYTLIYNDLDELFYSVF